jgi:hypothetical protein
VIGLVPSALAPPTLKFISQTNNMAQLEMSAKMIEVVNQGDDQHPPTANPEPKAKMTYLQGHTELINLRLQELELASQKLPSHQKLPTAEAIAVTSRSNLKPPLLKQKDLIKQRCLGTKMALSLLNHHQPPWPKMKLLPHKPHCLLRKLVRALGP